MMRKIILNLCTSLDSFIEGANEEIDWCFTDQDYGMAEFLDNTDAIFMGRKSYEQLLELMPEAFPGKMKYIFSNTMHYQGDEVELITGDVEKAVSKVLEKPGKNIWLFGGANLITTFVELNLIDEMMIAIHPLILGNGKPLFQKLNKRYNLKLIDNKTYSTGLVQLTYSFDK